MHDLRSYPLPAALRAPVKPRPAAQASPPAYEEPQPHSPDALCEALTPAISAAIARMVRQRRYTP